MAARLHPVLSAFVSAATLLSACGRIGFDLIDDGSSPRADAGGVDSGGASLDAGPAVCTPPCTNGTCVSGVCKCQPGWIGEICDEPSPLGAGTDGAIVFSGAVNLSVANAPGRTCADGGDGVSYSVVGLAEREATLLASPAPGCLNAGDAVLLVNLQGSSGAVNNVGNYEFLIVESVTGSVVTFTTVKLQNYGVALDEGLGTARDAQRVVLQRVPQYTDVTVSTNATLTANPWDGVRGGVLAFRASGTARVDGRISMDGGGFAGGAPTTAPGGQGASGESYDGLGTPDIGSATGGGGGGRGADAGCTSVALPGAGGGHAEAGEGPATTSCVPAEPARGGALYGDALGSRLYLGSGGGAGGAYTSLTDNPGGAAGGAGGGIVAIFASRILGNGTISAAGSAGTGDPSGVECTSTATADCWDFSGPGGGGGGGVILVRSPIVSVATVRALGGGGGNGFDSGTGNGGPGGDGYTVISGLP